jgi:SHS2 domain-containing protein
VGDYVILEHTADVGLQADGTSLEDVFQTATRGMATIAGAWHPGDGDEVSIAVEARDLAGVLVEWLSEALYVQDARNASIAGVRLDSVLSDRAAGVVVARPFAADPSEGVQIKAVTYHQLSVERTEQGWRARVFFDV